MSYRIKRFIRGIRAELVRELYYEHNLKTASKIQSKIAVELSLLDVKNISRITEVKNISFETLNQRIQNGDKCFVSEISGRLISYHWMQTTGKHYVQQIGEWEEIIEGDAVIYHVHVHNDFRGNRINSFVYSEILCYCRNHGFNRVWIYTNVKNIFNRRALENLGFKVYKQTISLKFNNHYYLLKSKKIKF